MRKLDGCPTKAPDGTIFEIGGITKFPVYAPDGGLRAEYVQYKAIGGKWVPFYFDVIGFNTKGK